MHSKSLKFTNLFLFSVLFQDSFLVNPKQSNELLEYFSSPTLVCHDEISPKAGTQYTGREDTNEN